MHSAVISREYKQTERFWEQRYQNADSAAFLSQTSTLEQLILARLGGQTYFRRGLEVGSGRGRLVPFLANVCGHVDAIDTLGSLGPTVEAKAPNVTYIQADYPPTLPFRSPVFDFVLACHAFQHVVSDAVFTALTAEIKRVTLSGGRLIIIDNAVDRAGHIKYRSPDIFAKHLGLKPGFFSERLSINKPNDHWLIDGVFL